MKKKIKDLSYEEREKICINSAKCNECPLCGEKNTSILDAYMFF